jgi:L-rhamnose mutarotase
MKRIAQILFVNPGQYEEYEKRHANLWPEMEKALIEHGARNYSIFLNKQDGNLFAYLEVENQAKYNEIANTEICKKWWDYMAPIMKVNDDNSPVTIDLTEVFHLREGE